MFSVETFFLTTVVSSTSRVKCVVYVKYSPCKILPVLNVVLFFCNLVTGILSEVKPAAKIGAFSGERSHQLPFFLKNEDLTVEEHERLIRERYSNLATCETDTKQTDRIFSRSSKDLSIWKVKCMVCFFSHEITSNPIFQQNLNVLFAIQVGRETLVTVGLFQKFIHMNTIGTKLPIVSVFSLEHIKGCVYIEAEKEADVTEVYLRNICCFWFVYHISS